MINNLRHIKPHIVHCWLTALSKVSSFLFLLCTQTRVGLEPGNEPHSQFVRRNKSPIKHLNIIIFLIHIGFRIYSQNPVADFEVNIIYKCGYATTEFKNNSINADTFLWDENGTGYFIRTFEPRGTNIEINKSWIVTLIAKGNGLSDTLSKEVEVFNTKIRFDKTAADTNLYAPLNVNFINKSIIRDEDTLSYIWDFGDGQQSDLESPIHTYTIPGTYFVTLSGIKTDGCELFFFDYVIVKDTAQKGEFEFITPDCACVGELEAPPCEYNKHFEYRNDSLFIYGFYSGNCGTYWTATIRYYGDTVKIKTWEVGPLTTCSCGCCFEIVIPNITQDSVIVMFNDEIILSKLTSIPKLDICIKDIRVVPNPVNNYLTFYIQGITLSDCEYIIMDMNGKILQKGLLNKQNQIKLRSIEKGAYLICVRDIIDNKIFVTKFLKY
jgi:hypothetical protein